MSYIIFSVPVTAKTVQQFFNIVRSKLRAGIETITVLISSPGGQVSPGIAAYNFLKGVPAEVVTHNIGQIDSMAIVMYCAGSRRYCSPNSRFLIHGIGFNAKEGQRFDERLVAEKLESLRSERVTISRIISVNSNRTLEQVEDDMFRGVVWTPEQAINNGLAHEIRTQLFERGAEVDQVPG